MLIAAPFNSLTFLQSLNCSARIMKGLLLVPCLVHVMEAIIFKEYKKVTDRKPPKWASTIDIEGGLSIAGCAVKCILQNDCIIFTIEKG